MKSVDIEKVLAEIGNRLGRHDEDVKQKQEEISVLTAGINALNEHAVAMAGLRDRLTSGTILVDDLDMLTDLLTPPEPTKDANVPATTGTRLAQGAPGSLSYRTGYDAAKAGAERAVPAALEWKEGSMRHTGWLAGFDAFKAEEAAKSTAAEGQSESEHSEGGEGLESTIETGEAQVADGDAKGDDTAAEADKADVVADDTAKAGQGKKGRKAA